MAWRYVMKADPFSDDKANHIFVSHLMEVLKMNHMIAKRLTPKHASDDQISKSMRNVRDKPVSDKYIYYQEFRVKEQLEWYQRKARFNEKRSKQFLGLLITFSLIILFGSICRVFIPKTRLPAQLPIDILTSLMTVFFTWLQTKKYKELSNAYSLTANEKGFIKTPHCTEPCGDKLVLGGFVIDTEAAFSREHTQWLARKS
jgi:hypothetical protein